MEIPFVGGAYTGRSKNVNAQQCINFFPVIDDRGAKNGIVLQETPGLLLFSTVVAETTTTINRGMWVFGDVIYVVIKDTVYSVDSDGVATSLGTITTTVGNIFFADNGTEVILVDGTTSAYLITAGVLAIITDSDFPIASSVTFQDGYFIITSSNGRIYISGLYDGTTWDALDFAAAEANPDDSVVVISNSHDLWIFGEKTSEIYYNSGNVDFPFVRISGGILELGTIASASVLKIDGIIYWLSNKNRVVRTRGYQFDTVSTEHIDYQISTYSDISDARAFTYEKQGHLFYVLNFPTAKKTWVYDITTDFWHEWQSYSTILADVPWERHRANSCAKFGSKYIVGDYINGLLYEIKVETYTDNLNAIRRIRANRVVNKERYWIIWHRVEIDFETGVGLDGALQGDDPQVMLQWSDDGGHTWSNERWKSIGKIGEYKTKAVWRCLGKSRNRILKLTISDPIKINIVGAYADLEECIA